MKVHVKTKNVTLSQTDQRVLDRLTRRLDKRLKTFDPDLVQLDLTVERHARRPEYTGSLRLFVVNRTLTAARNTGDTASALLHEAFSDIEEQLDRFKAELRGDASRRRRPSPGEATRSPATEVPATSGD